LSIALYIHLLPEIDLLKSNFNALKVSLIDKYEKTQFFFALLSKIPDDRQFEVRLKYTISLKTRLNYRDKNFKKLMNEIHLV
jgi:hypothetical protein